MALFDFFKSPQRKKQDDFINDFTNHFFPGGEKQVEKEAQELREILDYRYTLNDVFKSYIHTSIMFTQNQELEIVVGSVLRQEGCPLTKNDAIKIFEYVSDKQRRTFFKSKVNSALINNSDSDNIFLIVKGGIVELKKSYKDLNEHGKFEVILFNSIVAFRVYANKYPNKFKTLQEQYSTPLVKQAMNYKVHLLPNQLIDFINSRFDFYQDEIEQMYSNKQYIASKVHGNFYINPLAQIPKSSTDIVEVMRFYPALTAMFRWVHENVKSKYK